jgi:cell division protein ZipA
MDKDLMRILIFASGLLVIIGMIAWSYFKHEKLKRSYENFDDDSQGRENSTLGYNESDYEAGLDELDGYDEYGDDYNPHEPVHSKNLETEQELAAQAASVAAAIKKPAIIQFSLVSNRDEGFNGTEIFEILDDVGLEYGNLQIFERLDARRLVDYGVANMVKPGIFPSTNLAAFHCPGIVFFMQPGKVDNPVAVFDDFVRTFQYVATQLGGEMRDHHREPLTEETIDQLRRSLSLS